MQHQDIVERLQAVSGWDGDHGDVVLCQDAANAIEKLRTSLRDAMDSEAKWAHRAAQLQYQINQTLAPEERAAIEQAIAWIECGSVYDEAMPEDYMPMTDALRVLLQRTTTP